MTNIVIGRKIPQELLIPALEAKLAGIIVIIAVLWLWYLTCINLLLLFGTATSINVTAFGLIFIGLSICLIGFILIEILKK